MVMPRASGPATERTMGAGGPTRCPEGKENLTLWVIARSGAAPEDGVMPPQGTARLIKDRYEVLETLGAGGEGLVVKALDCQHDRLVALKIRAVRDDRPRDELV